MAFHPAHVLAAVLVALAASSAAAQTAIKFTLDGPVEGPEALVLLPRDKGYFKAEGLKVSPKPAIQQPSWLSSLRRRAQSAEQALAPCAMSGETS